MRQDSIIKFADHRKSRALGRTDITRTLKRSPRRRHDNADIIGLALRELKRGDVSEGIFSHITAAAMMGDPAAQIVANKVLLKRYPWLALSGNDLKAFSRRVCRGLKDGQPVSLDVMSVESTEVRHDR